VEEVVEMGGGIESAIPVPKEELVREEEAEADPEELVEVVRVESRERGSP